MPVRKMKFVLVNNMAPRNPLSARSARDRWNGATCTVLTLLRDRVLPQMDAGEWIRRIGRSNEPTRTRYRLAEAHR